MAKIIVREQDGKEYAFDVGDSFKTSDTVLWDERKQGPPPADLLATASANTSSKLQEAEDAKNQKKTARDDALGRLLLSNDKDTQDLMVLLGFV